MMGCPRLLYVAAEGSRRLFPVDVSVTAEVQMTEAVVLYELSFPALPADATSGSVMVLVPLHDEHCMVTGCTVTVGEDKFYETMVVESSVADKAPKDEAAMRAICEDTGLDASAYDPTCFKMPLADVEPGTPIAVCVEVISELAFTGGQYQLTVPLRVPTLNVAARPPSLALTCRLKTGMETCAWHCASSHELEVADTGDGRADLRAARGAHFVNEDLVVGYESWTSEVRGVCLAEHGPTRRGGGKFALFISPPTLQDARPFAQARRVCFLIDVSGSMAGVLSSAREALVNALASLNEQDAFSICAFNHEAHWYGSEAPGASAVFHDADRVEDATAFVRGLRAGGGTDILTPVQQGYAAIRAAPAGGAASMPIVMVITDGAVANEKDIVSFVSESNGSAAEKSQSVRFFTFGIGPYCNRYFLKMLATVGRGYSDFFLTEGLEEKMSALIGKASVPVLTDTKLLADGSSALELFPSPMPDLYVNAPLLVVGSYKGALPESLTFRATKGDGEDVSLRIPVEERGSMPVAKIFAKKQLDCLVAAHWASPTAAEAKALHAKAVAVSVEESIPSPFTTTVAYDAGPPPPPPPPPEDEDGGDSDAAPAYGPRAVAVPPAHKRLSEEERKAQMKTLRRGREKNSGKGVAVFVLGSAAVGAVAFGSIMATQHGLDVGSALGAISVDGGVFDGLGLPGILDFDLTCCDCLKDIGAVQGLDDVCCFNVYGAVDGFEAVFDAAGSCVGDCFGHGQACCGDIITHTQNAGGAFECVWFFLRDTSTCVFNQLGSVGGCAGAACADVGSCLGGCGGALADVGSCLGGCGGALADAGSCAGDCVGGCSGACEAVAGALGGVQGCCVGFIGACSDAGDIAAALCGACSGAASSVGDACGHIQGALGCIIEVVEGVVSSID